MVWGPAHRVISTADTQHRHSCLIHIPEGVVAVPVGVPADGETLSVTEEGLLQLLQGVALEHLPRVHCVIQGSGVPGSKKLDRAKRREGIRKKKKKA